MGKFGQNEPVESCLDYDEANGCLVYTTNLGNDKTVKLPSDKVTGTLTDDCELVIFVNGVECDREDITKVLKKYNFSYNTDTHTVTSGPDGAEVPFVLNCATLELGTANGCELVYTNEKGGETRLALPLLSMARDETACTITADDGKGGEFVFYEGANPETDIDLELDDNKDLCLRYKSKECHIVLPNFVTDIALDITNCNLKVMKWCDEELTTIDLYEALGVTKNDDGGFEIKIKDKICTFSPATLAQDPDNPLVFYFDNQYGQTETITLPSDTVVDNGDTYTFTQTDGTEAIVCKNPVKTVNGAAPDAAGDVAFNQAVVLDNGDGTGTVTDSQGNGCVFLKNVTIPADVRITGFTLVESADGSTHTLEMTLSDGSTLGPVSVIDQFSSIADNGDGTATLTTPQGAKSNIVCGVQSNVVETADTFDFTQNDGSTASVCKNPVKTVNGVGPDGSGDVAFDQATVADNADGTATITDKDSNSCIVSAIYPVKKDGSDYAKGDRPRLFDLDELDDPERGPVQDVSIVDRVLQVTWCDSTERCFRNSMRNRRSSYTAPNMVVRSVDSDTAVAGTVISPEDGCITVEGGKCGTEVQLVINHSYTGRFNSGSRGALVFRPQINIDGGGWQNVSTGGVDEIKLNDFAPADLDVQIGEISFIDTQYISVGPGDHEICWRLLLDDNDVSAGNITVVPRSAEMFGLWNEMIDCTP